MTDNPQTEDETKRGARNSAADKERIAGVRDHARAIEALADEMEPDEDMPDDEMEPETMSAPTGKMRFKLAGKNISPRVNVTSQAKMMRPMSELVDPGYEVLGIPFGGPLMGRDSDGECFHPDTNIWLHVGDVVNLTYYHGFGPDEPYDYQADPVIIGRATYSRRDDRGDWFQPMLDPQEPLAMRCMVQPEIVRASSGAVGHLVRMGQAGMIDVWPVGELALFDINTWRLPANDYAVVEQKLAEQPEAAAEPAPVAAAPQKSTKGKANMSDNTNEPQAQAIDYTALAAALAPVIDASVKAQIEALSTAPATNDPGPATRKGAPNLNTKFGYGDPDPAEDFLTWIRTGEGKIKKHTVIAEIPDGRGGKMKAAIQEGTDSEGGYLVPTGELGQIIAKRDEAALAPKLGVATFSTDRDQFAIPTEGTAMTRFTIVSEEGDISAAENEPTFGSAGTPPVTLYNFKKLIKVSEEILEDFNSGLEAFLTNGLGRAWAITDNYYLQVGGGSGAPQGVFVGGTAALTLDSATAIGAAEVPELMGKLKEAYLPGAAMLMKRTTKAYLAGLTGNQFIFGGTELNNFGDALSQKVGYPVYGTEDAAAIGAGNKSMIFGNFGLYGLVRNRSLRVRRLVELYATTGQVGILANYRMGGAVLQAEALQYATHPTA